MDAYEGSSGSPVSLHKYQYANADPVNGIDPLGNSTLAEVMTVSGLIYLLSVNLTTPTATMRCGEADVTDAAQQAIDQAEAKYSSITDMAVKSSLCKGLYDIPDALNAWDIYDLASVNMIFFGGWPYPRHRQGTGHCAKTVTYEGKCYHGGAVNYLLWGRINRACNRDFPEIDLEEAHGYLTAYKLLFLGQGADAARKFTTAGYNYSEEPPKCEIRGCDTSGAWKTRPSDWHWFHLNNVLK